VNINGEVVLKNGTANVTFVSTSFTPRLLLPIGDNQVQRSRMSCMNFRTWLELKLGACGIWIPSGYSAEGDEE
jgi:hypothetical protein